MGEVLILDTNRERLLVSDFRTYNITSSITVIAGYISVLRLMCLLVLGIATPIPQQPQFILPLPASQFTQGSGSDQNTG